MSPSSVTYFFFVLAKWSIYNIQGPLWQVSVPS